MNAYVHRICLYIKITCFMYIFLYIGGFPGGSVVKNLLANAGDAGDTGSDSWVGKISPGGGNGNLFQYSRLENATGRGAWQAIQSMGSQESDMTE